MLADIDHGIRKGRILEAWHGQQEMIFQAIYFFRFQCRHGQQYGVLLSQTQVLRKISLLLVHY